MRKHLSNIIIFTIILTLLAASGLDSLKRDFVVSAASEMLFDDVVNSDDSDDDTKFKKDLALFTAAFDVKTINSEIFQSRSMYFADRSAQAADGQVKNGWWIKLAGSDEYDLSNLPSGGIPIYSENTNITFIKYVDGVATTIDAGYTFEIEAQSQGETDVVGLADVADKNETATLVRKGPGTATITVKVQNAGSTITMTFNVRVGFKIDTTPLTPSTGSNWENYNSNKYLKLFYDPNATAGTDSSIGTDDFKLKFKYTKDDAGNPADEVIFSSKEVLEAQYFNSEGEAINNIVQYVNVKVGANQYTPVLRPTGAGFCKVVLTPESGSSDPVEINVVVVPRGTADLGETGNPDGDSDTGTFEEKTYHYAASSDRETYLYINGIAGNLNWVVERMKYDDNDDPVDSDYFRTGVGEVAYTVVNGTTSESYVPSYTDGKLVLSGLAAGTYKVRGLVKNSIVGAENVQDWTTVQFLVFVKPNLNGREVTLNKGDSFAIFNTTNISLNKYSDSFTIDSTEDGTIVDVDADNGIVTGKEIGTATVTVKYKNGSTATSQLYPKAFVNTLVSGVAGGNWTAEYSVKVINDGISISNSQTSSGSTKYKLSLGQTGYRLYARVPDESNGDVYWEVSDNTVVCFDTDPSASQISGRLSVAISALKATNGNPVTITAYQIIDGVKKVTSCLIEVSDEITEVTFSSTDVEIEAGDGKYVWITSPAAAADPDASKYMTWIVADTNIIKLVANGSEEELDVGKGSGFNIKALKPGKSTITVVNSANDKVVGVINVTVLADTGDIVVNHVVAGEIVPINNGDEITINVVEELNHQLYAFTDEGKTEITTGMVWELNTDEFIEIVSGKITVKDKDVAGTTMVTASYNDKKIVSFNVTVKKEVHVDGFDVNCADSIEIYVGETLRYNYTISPSDSDDCTVKAEVFEGSVATVTAPQTVYNGYIEITGVAPGTTYVTVIPTDTYNSDKIKMKRIKVTVKRKATSVIMNYSTLTIAVGQYFDMPYTINPSDATEKTITFTSLQPEVATVSSSGRITGVAVGQATILAQAENGPVSYCTVTVQSNLAGITITPENATIETGETLTFKAVFNPEDATNKDVTWTSSNPEVATVNEAGMVEGLRGGYTVISAVSADGGYTAFALLKVDEPVYRINLDPEEYILGINKSFVINAEITNKETALDTTLNFTSMDTKIATVDKTGKVTGRALGETIILVESADGEAQAICRVEVVREVTGIKLNYTTQTVLVGNSFALKATVTPSNANYTDVNFAADDDSLVIVDDDGIVTGIKPGSTFVRVSAQDNSGKYALCYVTVINPIASSAITASENSLTMFPGESKNVVMTIRPSNSTDSLNYASSNDSVATVSSVTNKDGVINATIRATGIGTANITFMTSSGRSTQIAVTVLGLSRTYIEMPVYTTYSTLVVDGATTTVRWDVSDPTICEVNNGVITARKVGTTTILATVNGRTLKCTVVVTPKE